MLKPDRSKPITPTDWISCAALIDKTESSILIKCPENDVRFSYHAFTGFNMDENTEVIYGAHFFANFETMEMMPVVVVSVMKHGEKYRVGEMVGPKCRLFTLEDRLISRYLTEDIKPFKIIHIERQDLYEKAIETLQPKYEQWLLETHLLGSETINT